MNWTLLLLVSTAITGTPIVLKALRSIKAKVFSIELLISISLAGALFIGEYVEAAALSFLFALGAYLEKAALRRIRTAVHRQVGAQPHMANPTTHERMMERLEEAQESEASGQQFLQQFARIYTPLIIGCSVLVYFLTHNVAQALTFLVIACPGALVISVPASLAAGLAKAARHGIFMRDAAALEKLATVDPTIFQSPNTGEHYEAAGITIIMGTRPEPYLDDADIVVWSDQPADIQRAINIARATVANMKQNTYFSLATVALLLAGVFFGSIQMASGIFLHEMGILLVILNALRLLRHGQ
jgi:cation transport ATPase